MYFFGDTMSQTPYATNSQKYMYLSLSADNEKRALWNMTFTSAKVIYNNPSYDAKYDNNPYTVPATIDFSDMHKNFTHQMIVIR